MEKQTDIMRKYFGDDVSDRDRAIFEAGISLGALFHQFIGIPLKNDPDFIKKLEEVIQESISIQPYVEEIKVKILLENLKKCKNEYDYSVLDGKFFQVNLVTKYGNVRVFSVLKYIEEIDYPLMFIEKIEE